MRRDPHCYGCGKRIWWKLVLHSTAKDFNVGLYFHKRCVLPYRKGTEGPKLAIDEKGN
jgi:hypothetical protein